MGTPDFARDSLEAIYNAGHEILSVITVPDRPKGRGMKLVYSEVKEYALSKNLKVLQPDKLRENTQIIEQIKDMNPDIKKAYFKNEDKDGEISKFKKQNIKFCL